MSKKTYNKALHLIAASLLIVTQSVQATKLKLSTDQQGDTFIGDPPYPMRISMKAEDNNRPLTALALSVWDVMYEKEVAAIRVPLNPALKPGEHRTLTVSIPGLVAGAYRVTVKADGTKAELNIARLLGPDPPPDRSLVPFFGFNDHKYSLANFSLYSRFGGRVKRDVFYWHDVHVAPGIYDWRTADERIAWLRKAGIEPLPILCYTPSWAKRLPTAEKGGNHVPPRNLHDFEDYVAQAAKRYGRIRFWEVWNEENIGFFLGSAEDYADIQKAAFQTLRRQSPKTLVVMGGTAGIDFHFLDRLADSGAMNYCDALAVHTYSWGPPEVIIPKLKALREWRDHNAPGRPIWCTEWGHKCAEEGGQSPRVQAEYVARQTIIHKAYDLAHSSYYVWLWAAFKVMNYNLSPKPAAIALRTCAQQLTNARVVGALVEDDNAQFGYVFERDGELILAAWTRSGKSQLEGVTVTANAKLYDLNGVAKEIERSTHSITLSTMPVFVTGLHPNMRNRLTPITPEVGTRPRPLSPNIWLRFQYPPGSNCVPCPREGGGLLRISVEHRGPSASRVRLRAAAPAGMTVTPHEISVTLSGDSTHVVTFRIRAASKLADGRYKVIVSATAGGQSCGFIRAVVWVADGLVTEFTCNEYEERLHRTADKHAGAAEGVVWTTGSDGFIEWSFNLQGCQGATLTMDCGAHLGKKMAVRATADGNSWRTLYEGSGTDRKRTWNLKAFVGSRVRIRLLDLSKKRPSGARVRSFHLMRIPDQQPIKTP